MCIVMLRTLITSVIVAMLMRSSHSTALPETSFTFAMNCLVKMNPNESKVLAIQSINDGMAMLLNISRGKTADEILEVAYGNRTRTGVEEDKKKRHQTIGSYNKTMLTSVNILSFLEDTDRLSLEVEALLYGQPKKTNFIGANDGNLTQRVNQAVEQSTRGVFKKVFKDGPQEARLILKNLMCIKADLRTAFVKQDSSESVMEFKVESGKVDSSITTIPSLYGKVELVTYVDDELQADLFRIPFEEENLHFYIILPSENATIGQVARKLTGDKWIDVIRRLNEFQDGEYVNTSIEMPKLTINTKLSMKSILENMGISTAFGDAAELFYKNSTFKVEDVENNAVFQINENEEEASPVPTERPFHGTSGDFESYTIDRPFIFAVANAETNDAYFIGSFMGPD